MSLINDALRRAKDAQRQVPPPPPNYPPLRPVEPAQQTARQGLGLLLPIALAVVALLVLLFAWQWVQRNGSLRSTEAGTREVRATTRVALPPPTVVPPDLAAAGFVPVAQSGAAPQPAPASPPSPRAAHVPAASAAPAVPDESAADAQVSETTNAPAVTAPPPPKPAPLRLQGIVFNPSRPSAMINGRTVFVGDKMGDTRVVAIDRDSVTLVRAGQTNVLSLSE